MNQIIPNIELVIIKRRNIIIVAIAIKVNVPIKIIHVQLKNGIIMLHRRHRINRVLNDVITKKKIVHVLIFRAVDHVQKNLKSKVYACIRVKNNINRKIINDVIFHVTVVVAKRANIAVHIHRVKVVQNQQVQNIAKNIANVPIHIHPAVHNHLHLRRVAVHHDHIIRRKIIITPNVNILDTTNIILNHLVHHLIHDHHAHLHLPAQVHRVHLLAQVVVLAQVQVHHAHLHLLAQVVVVLAQALAQVHRAHLRLPAQVVVLALAQVRRAHLLRAQAVVLAQVHRAHLHLLAQAVVLVLAQVHHVNRVQVVHLVS